MTQLLTQCCISLILAQEVDFASVNALKRYTSRIAAKLIPIFNFNITIY